MRHSSHRSGKGIAVARTVSTESVGERFASGDHIRFEGATVSGADFRGSRFDSFSSLGSTFLSCDFAGAELRAGSFGIGPHQSTFVKCLFNRADLRGMRHVGNARFENCNFDHAQIVDWASDAGEFVECLFAGQLRQCRFAGRPWGAYAETNRLDPRRAVNQFVGNDFRSAELVDCSFIFGIDVSAQLWPESSDYVRLDRLRERVIAVRSSVATWPSDHDREVALAILRAFERPGQAEQSETILRRSDWPPPVSDTVLSMLEGALPSRVESG